MKGGTDNVQNFNPRSPQGGATRPSRPASCGKTFQSTLPARGSDDGARHQEKHRHQISIHAPRKGERHVWVKITDLVTDISIHAPRKGERPASASPSAAPRGFQSTLPARGSDTASLISGASRFDFNPRSPQGGATFVAGSAMPPMVRFQSTLPARGSDDGEGFVARLAEVISIHAPRKGERRGSLRACGRRC